MLHSVFMHSTAISLSQSLAVALRHHIDGCLVKTSLGVAARYPVALNAGYMLHGMVEGRYLRTV